MNCQQARKHLTDFVYGLAQPELAQQIECHANKCDACRDQLSIMSQAAALLDRSAEATNAEDVRIETSRVLSNAVQRADRAKGRWRQFTSLTITAAVLFGLMNLLSIRIEAHPTRLVIGWGDERLEDYVPPSSASNLQFREIGQTLSGQQSRLEEVDRLLRLLVAVTNNENVDRARDVDALRSRLIELENRADTRWRTVNHMLRNVRAAPLHNAISLNLSP